MSKPVAMVTGGSRGIGLGVAGRLAAAGFDLVVNGRRAADEVRDALTWLESAGAQVLYVQMDVADLASHGPALDKVSERFGRLDALVNNAGVAPDVRADLLEASPESFDRLISINLRGPYFLTQAVAALMIRSGTKGVVVNVSSISATVVSTNRGDYCISKAGVAMATQLWAARLAECKIAVYEVRPGVIETDMTSGVKQRYDAFFAAGGAVENRWGTPDDVGRAVAMLCRGDLSYAPGQVLVIDGGLTMRRL
jgi:NAD(P)-dependent dehydrogenase (short-subunit alcohol dehydrogenase family)